MAKRKTTKPVRGGKIKKVEGAGKEVKPINEMASFLNFQSALAFLESEGLTVVVDHKLAIVPKTPVNANKEVGK